MSKQLTFKDQIFDAAAAALSKALDALDQLDFNDRVDAINTLRTMITEHSPFNMNPVDCIQWVPAPQVAGNDYNPNTVAPPEMRLLELSIKQDGFTQPVVAYRDADDHYTVVDGFHRCRVAKEHKLVNTRVYNHIPLAIINHARSDIKDRMAATIRHNRARGVHGIVPLTDMVEELIRQGWGDSQIAIELGMDADEVLRFKQNCGLPELFKNHDYSRSWE